MYLPQICQFIHHLHLSPALLLTTLEICHRILLLVLDQITVRIVIVVVGSIGHSSNFTVGIRVCPILEVTRSSMLTQVVGVLRVGLECDFGRAKRTFLLGQPVANGPLR